MPGSVIEYINRIRHVIYIMHVVLATSIIASTVVITRAQSLSGYPQSSVPNWLDNGPSLAIYGGVTPLRGIP